MVSIVCLTGSEHTHTQSLPDQVTGGDGWELGG